MDIRVEENPAAVVAEMLGETAAAGGHIVLTGGSTPKLAYEMASRAGVDWTRATVWFSDERCVPDEHGLSNFRMAEGSLSMSGFRTQFREHAEQARRHGAGHRVAVGANQVLSLGIVATYETMRRLRS